jgi:hypothetical protein
MTRTSFRRIQTRTASEDSSVPRLRFGLVSGITVLAVAAAAVHLFSAPSALAAADVSGWGIIQGQIVLAGSVPEQKPIAAVKTHQDAKYCLANGPVLDEDWVVNPKNKGVKWAFVWLQADKDKELPIHPALKEIKQKKLVMDQPCCSFVPHALGMREGQVLVAKNSAPMPHNYKWGGNPTKNPGGNVLIPAGAKIEIKDLVADRLPITVSCTIHPWMRAWVRIFNHPYFAVTDESGNFEIKDAPAGDYHLVVWHESVGWGTPGGKNGEPIHIRAGGMTKVPTIELKASK